MIVLYHRLTILTSNLRLRYFLVTNDGSFATGEYTYAFCLTSELVDLQAWYVHPYSSAEHSSRFNSYVGSTMQKDGKFAPWGNIFRSPLGNKLPDGLCSNVNPIRHKVPSELNSPIGFIKKR